MFSFVYPELITHSTLKDVQPFSFKKSHINYQYGNSWKDQKFEVDFDLGIVLKYPEIMQDNVKQTDQSLKCNEDLCIFDFNTNCCKLYISNKLSQWNERCMKCRKKIKVNIV